MKRIEKALLLTARKSAYKWNLLTLYYWSDQRLSELRGVYVMPKVYYRWLYRSSMWLAGYRNFQKLGNWAIHTIPLHIRFQEG